MALNLDVSLDFAGANRQAGAQARKFERQFQQAFQRGANRGLEAGIDSRRFTLPLGRITSSASEFSKSLAAANARVLTFTASAGLLFQLVNGFRALVQSTIAVEKSLKDINVVLNASSRNLNKFKGELFDVARNTGQSFSAVAEAATELSRQGLSLQETLKRTSDALILTRLSGLSAVDAVESLTATINSFNRSALDSTEIVNKLANVDAKFAVSSKDLAEAIRRVGSSAQDASVDFNELIALVTSVQETTARGGQVIGNSLKTIFTRLQRTSVLDQLEDLGVVVRDINEEALPAVTVLRNLATSFSQLSKARQAQTAESVAGVFQINILRAILADLSKGTTIYERALNAANEETATAILRNKELNTTLSALANKTLEDLREAASAVGNVGVAPIIRELLGAVSDVANVFKGADSPQTTGQSIMKGIFEGMANFITGPGGVLIVGILAKLGKEFIKFGAEVSKSFIQINNLSTQRKALAEQINATLQREPGLINAIIAGTKTETQAAIELLRIKQQSLLVDQRRAQISQTVANQLVGSGIRLSGSGDVKFGSIGSTIAPRKLPNFATGDALKQAIKRERAEGIPKNKIRVESHPALISSQNPLGLAVTNTIDEPGGVTQGISRVKALGGDPKKSGSGSNFVPNFAPRLELKPETRFAIGSRASGGLIAQADREYAKIARELKEMGRGFEEAKQKAKALAQRIGLSDDSVTRMNQSIDGLRRRYSELNTGAEIAARQSNLKKITQTPAPTMTLSLAAADQALRRTATQSAGQPLSNFAFGRATAGTSVLGPQLPGFPTVTPQQGPGFVRPTNEAYVPGLGLLSGQRLQEHIGQQAGRLMAEMRERLQSSLLSQELELARLEEQAGGFFGGSAEREIGRRLNRSTDPNQASRLREIKNRIKQRRSQRAQNAGLAASFALPVLGGAISNAFIQGDTLGDRRGRSVIQGVGTAAGFAGLAAGLGTGPIGVTIGATIGGISALNSIMKDWNNTLPDIQKNIKELTEAQTVFSNTATELLKIQDQLSNPSLGLTERSRLEARRASLFTSPGGKELKELLSRLGIERFPDAVADKVSKEQLKIDAESLAGLFSQARNEGISTRIPIGPTNISNSPSFVPSLLTQSLARTQSRDLLTNTEATRNLATLLLNAENRQGENITDLNRNPGFADLFREFGKSGDLNRRLKILNVTLNNLGLIDFVEPLGKELEQFTDGQRKAIFDLIDALVFNSKAIEKQTKIDEDLNAIDDTRARQLRDFRTGTRNRLLGRSQERAGIAFDAQRSLSILTRRQATGISGLEQDLTLQSPFLTREAIARREAGINLQNVRNTGALERLRNAQSLGGLSIGGGFLSKIQKSSALPTKGEQTRIQDINTLQGRLFDIAASGARGQVDDTAIADFIRAAEEVRDRNLGIINDPNKPGRDQGFAQEIQEVVEELKKIQKQDSFLEEQTTFAVEDAAETLKDKLEELKQTSIKVAKGDFLAGRVSGARFRDIVTERNLEAVRTGGRADVLQQFSAGFAFNNQDLQNQLLSNADELAVALKDGLKDATREAILSADSISEAFANLGRRISEKVLDQAIGSVVDIAFGAVQRGFSGFSTGGHVTGGSGVKDDVPALLTDGEFVIRKEAVDRYGRGLFEALNKNTSGINSTLRNEIKFANTQPGGPSTLERRIDPNLSILAQTDPNNPQNQLKFSREDDFLNYIQDFRRFQDEKQKALNLFRKQKRRGLTAAFIGAALTIGAGSISQFSGNRSGIGQGVIAGGGSGTSIDQSGAFRVNSFGQGPQFAATGGILRRARGGPIFGNDSQQDNIPALLTAGEFVIRKDVTKKLGTDFLSKLNEGKLGIRGFQDGGLVGNNSSAPMGMSSNGSFERLISISEGIKASLDLLSSQQASNNGGLPNNTTVGAAATPGINNNVSITVNVESNGTTNSQRSENTQGEGAESEAERARQLSESIEAVVLKTIIEQQRPGGLIPQRTV